MKEVEYIVQLDFHVETPPLRPDQSFIHAAEEKSLTFRVNKRNVVARWGRAAQLGFFFISHFYYRLDGPSANYKHPPKIVPFDLNLCDSQRLPLPLAMGET